MWFNTPIIIAAEELKLVEYALSTNDHPNWFIKQTKNRVKTKLNDSAGQDRKPTQGIVVLSFIPKYTEMLSKILTNFNLRVCTKPLRTNKNILPRFKDTIGAEFRTGAANEIPCLECSGAYIGETGRCYATRLKEHQRDVNA